MHSRKINGKIIFATIITIFVGCNSNSSSNNTKRVSKSSFQMITKNLTGKQYSLKTSEYVDFLYERKYSDSGKNYKTIYQTYNPNSGNAIHKITLVYDKNSEEISVNVKAVFGGIFAPEDLNYKLKVTKEFKTSEPWGKEGFYRKLYGSGVPYEILIQFINNENTYLNILEIKSEDNRGDRYWYFLDKMIQNEQE